MTNIDLSKYGINGAVEILHNPSYDVLFAEETKPGLEGFDNVLEGMTALAMSSDAVAPAKILCKYAKDNENFTIKAGFIDGRVIDVAEIEALAAIPGREGLIAKMLGSIQSPLYGLAIALQAIVDKSGEAPAEAPAEA